MHITPERRLFNAIQLLSLGFLASCGALTSRTTASTTCIPTTDSATYTISFDATWSAATHPTDFPSSPHFSRLIGLTHNSSFTLWEDGGTATEGVESMAESGSVATLSSEITAAISAGTGGVLAVNDSNLNPSPGTTSNSFTATKDFTLASFVTMVAPSPDWFVGFNATDLCSSNDWISSTTITAFAYDAGTDSGTSYTSTDADVTPHNPIAKITTTPVIDSNGDSIAFGTFTLTKQ